MHHKQSISYHSFADDTNILVSSSDLNELNSKLNSVLHCISKWFQNNQLVLNLNRMAIIKFASSKLLTYPLNTWKSHVDNLIKKKLSSISFMLRILLPIINVKMLCITNFAHFYSQLNHCIIFWGSSS